MFLSDILMKLIDLCVLLCILVGDIGKLLLLMRRRVDEEKVYDRGRRAL